MYIAHPKNLNEQGNGVEGILRVMKRHQLGLRRNR